MAQNKKTKGTSLLMTILILTAILSIGFGVARLMLGEMKLSKDAPNSLKSYYAAESGIERKLYEIRKQSNTNNIGSPPSCIGGGAVCLEASDNCYAVSFASGTPNTIKSYGCYRGTTRAIEVTY